ncbi:MAG: Tfx family DNA-binding protein [Methanoregula sp.]|nr:Tfx family DNA-binding protein [Methanoregula sp.]
MARLLNTMRQNIYALETNANKNIQRAKNTLNFYNTLDARLLCTVKEGDDLIDAITNILNEAKKTGILVTVEPIDLANRLRTP